MKKYYLFVCLLLCVFYVQSQVPTNQDCEGAIIVTQPVYFFATGFLGSGNIPDEIPINQNCPNHCLHYGEKSSVWFRVNIQQSGAFGFLITPNSSDTDYDWAVYDITNNSCSDIYSNSTLQVSCNVSAETGVTGATGSTLLNCQNIAGQTFNNVISVDSGDVYAVLVNNFSDNADGFTIEFSYSAVSIEHYANEQLVFIYPNPVNDMINISIPTSLQDKFDIEIFNLQGKQVYSKSFSHEEQIVIDVSILSAGHYLFRLFNAEKSFHSIFIRE